MSTRQVNLPAIAISVAAGVGVGLIVRKLLSKKDAQSQSNNPFGLPGPAKDDPELGNLGAIGAAGGILPYTLELHRKYGEIACIWWGNTPVVSLGSTKALRDIRNLTERPYMFFAAFEELIGAKSLQYMQGTEWSDRRKFYNHRLSRASIDRREYALFGPRDWLMDAVADCLKSNKAAMCRHLMFAAALRGIATFAFGEVFTEEKEINLLLEAYDDSMRVMIGMAMFGKEKTAEDEAALQRALDQFKRASEIAIEKRKVVRESGEDEEIMIDDMAQRLEPDTLVNDFITFLVAGFHTNGNSLVWLFYHLCKHPQYQDKIVAELNVSPSTTIDLAIADRSPTLVNCLDEALRYEGLGAFGARGNPDGPITVMGTEFPTNTNFLIAFGPCTSEGPEFEDPLSFNPDRWIPKDGSTSRPQYTAPFGVGKRRCPGMDFAVVEAKLLAASVLNKYKLALADPSYQMERNMTFVPTPNEDFALKLIPR